MPNLLASGGLNLRVHERLAPGGTGQDGTDLVDDVVGHLHCRGPEVDVPKAVVVLGDHPCRVVHRHRTTHLREHVRGCQHVGLDPHAVGVPPRRGVGREAVDHPVHVRGHQGDLVASHSQLEEPVDEVAQRVERAAVEDDGVVRVLVGLTVFRADAAVGARELHAHALQRVATALQLDLDERRVVGERPDDDPGAVSEFVELVEVDPGRVQTLLVRETRRRNGEVKHE